MDKLTQRLRRGANNVRGLALALLLALVPIGALVVLVHDDATATHHHAAGTQHIRVTGHWPCVEDELLVGVGDYVGGRGYGTWTCHPRDKHVNDSH
jgi:hypothetical protein